MRSSVPCRTSARASFGILLLDSQMDFWLGDMGGRLPLRYLRQSRCRRCCLYNRPSMAPTLSRPASSHFRWNVCALLFFATTINYMDRQVLSILAKTLETKIGWDSIQYGYITAAF